MYKILREKRKAKKYNASKMGEVINKTGTTYLKKERGEIPITVEEAKILCKFLKCSPLIFF